jgi:hypothetical protein
MAERWGQKNEFIFLPPIFLPSAAVHGKGALQKQIYARLVSPADFMLSFRSAQPESGGR